MSVSEPVPRVTTIIADFGDPLSFLASQRADRLAALGHDLRWLAVEGDRRCPIGAGRALDDALLARLSRLRLPGETMSTARRAPNSAAATAAYAESITDGCKDPMRRALFEAAWVKGARVDDPNVIRSLAYGVLNPEPLGDVRFRIQENVPVVPFREPYPSARSRQLGFLVSMGRGPLTGAGQARLDRWVRVWQQAGAARLPLVLTARGEMFSGERALQWLADQLAAHAAAPRPEQRHGEPVAA